MRRRTIIILLALILTSFLIAVIIISVNKTKESSISTEEKHYAEQITTEYNNDIYKIDDPTTEQNQEELTNSKIAITNNTYEKLSDKQKDEFDDLYYTLLKYNDIKELESFDITSIENSFLYITINYADGTNEEVVVAWENSEKHTGFTYCMSESDFEYYQNDFHVSAPPNQQY